MYLFFSAPLTNLSEGSKFCRLVWRNNLSPPIQNPVILRGGTDNKWNVPKLRASSSSSVVIVIVFFIIIIIFHLIIEPKGWCGPVLHVVYSVVHWNESYIVSVAIIHKDKVQWTRFLKRDEFTFFLYSTRFEQLSSTICSSEMRCCVQFLKLPSQKHPCG